MSMKSFNIEFRQFKREKDKKQVLKLIEYYYSNPQITLTKMPSEMEILLETSFLEENASFVAIEKGKIVGFVGSVIRESDDEKEGEIIGLSTKYESMSEKYFYILRELLNLAISALRSKEVKKVTTIATPRQTAHYRLLIEYGFRPIKAWYLMRAQTDSITFPNNIAEELEILSLKQIEQEKRSKMELILSILNAAFFGELGGGWDEWELGLKFSTPYYDPNGILVGYVSGKPVGLVWVFVEPVKILKLKKERGWIAFLGLKPEYRGRKYGRTLLKAGIEYLMKKKVREILLWVNSDNSTAIRLYRMFNFWIDRVSYLMWLPI